MAISKDYTYYVSEKATGLHSVLKTIILSKGSCKIFIQMINKLPQYGDFIHN